MRSKLVYRLLDLVYPTRCVFCRRFLPPGPVRMCDKCQETIPRAPGGGRRRGDFFSECVSPLYYQDDVKQRRAGGISPL